MLEYQTKAMTPPVLQVRFFKSDNGKEPVREWIKSLPAIDRRTIGEDMKTVQLGWPLGMPLVRKMQPNLWEVRISLSNGIARVFFTVSNEWMILLHGFIKKSDKTPKSELSTAQQRLKLFHKEIRP